METDQTLSLHCTSSWYLFSFDGKVWYWVGVVCFWNLWMTDTMRCYFVELHDVLLYCVFPLNLSLFFHKSLCTDLGILINRQVGVNPPAVPLKYFVSHYAGGYSWSAMCALLTKGPNWICTFQAFDWIFHLPSSDHIHGNSSSKCSRHPEPTAFARCAEKCWYS